MSEAAIRNEARAAIADLIHQYARHVRMDEPEAVSELFIPAGTLELRDGYPDRPDYHVRFHLAGRAAIHDHLAPTKGKPHPVPLIHNLMIRVDGDTASANCLMTATISGSDHRVFGEYHDRFVLADDRWHFSARCFTMFAA